MLNTANLYSHLEYNTNYPGEIVYEDEYQVAVKAAEDLIFEDIQESWSPTDEDPDSITSTSSK